jgi:pimeloyl-ACP methyl ester carboxylesterase
MASPIIFVHGIGASAAVWHKFPVPGRQVFYISFTRRYADPADQVMELNNFIDQVLKQTGQSKVILVCHSMGGLVARQYLADHRSDHKVDRLILLSTPNLGTVGLSFNWLPLGLMVLGALGYKLLWPMLLFLGGLGWEITSYLRGVLLFSPAAWAMRPNSRFLKGLNSKDLPVDVKYIAVLSDAKILPHRLVNIFLFRESGDGAIPVSSQKLSLRCVPNFSELDYAELKIDLPHFKIPKQCQAVVLQALKL